MVRVKLLHVTAVALTCGVITLGHGPIASASANGCSPLQASLGECAIQPVIEVTPDPDGVTIKGSLDVPGKTVGHSGGGDGSLGVPAPPKTQPLLTVDRPGYTATAPLSLSDLVNFKPTPGTDHMQPDGWMVVGLDTNFYARAAQQVKTGELLGQPASVRFTPVLYRWSYGDGAARTSGTPGSTWQALGVQEFDPTPTSHIYREPGTYYIDLAIGFSPEYRYASWTIWVPVPGIVWVPANRLVATAGGPKTVLVEDECTVNPFGPGC